MIKIITDRKYIPDGFELYDDAEYFVRGHVSAEEFGEFDLKALERIDNAKLIDKNTDAILTPFGQTDIFHLSMGCKTVLMYLHYKRHMEDFTNKAVFNISEAGWNAIDVLMDLAEGDEDTIFLLTHGNEVYRCKSHEYLINGTRIKKRLPL